MQKIILVDTDSSLASVRYIADDLKLSSELKQIYNNIIMDGCKKVKEICNIYNF